MSDFEINNNDDKSLKIIFDEWFNTKKESVWALCDQPYPQKLSDFKEAMSDAKELLDDINKLDNVPQGFKQFLKNNLLTNNVTLYNPIIICDLDSYELHYQAPEQLSSIWKNYLYTKKWLNELKNRK